jgi:glycosyltransferase involved in cell wall biosynthesis
MIVHARYPVGEPRVQRLAAAAVEAGYEVDVVCLRHTGEQAREVVECVDVHRLPLSHDRSSRASAMAVEYLAFAALATAKVAQLTARQRYDVVHVSNPPDLLVFAGLIPRLAGARLILDIHDLTPDLFEWRFGGSRAHTAVRRLLEWQERISVRTADSLMTVHDGCAGVLARRSARSGQSIEIVMNSVDERLLPNRATDHDGWHEPVRLVYHGSLTELYGVHTLIEAFARSGLGDRAALTILGDGDQRPALERQAERLGVGVDFSRGFVPIRQALDRVADSDIGAVPLVGLPINRFSLPSKLFEYVALGVPVIAARTDTIARHFDADELSFFRPGDADDLAARLEELVADPAAARARAQKALTRYESYRWEASKRRFLAVIAEPRTRGTRVRG